METITTETALAAAVESKLRLSPTVEVVDPALSSGPTSPTSTLPTPPRPIPPNTFPFFPTLPAELRLQIWRASFLPRAVEIHARPHHYADGNRRRWQSRSTNPAVLSTCAESRAAALEVYTLRLPLAAEGPLNVAGATKALYIAPAMDMLCVLGDFDQRVKDLLVAICTLHRAGLGLRRVGLSASPWTHENAAGTLRVFGRGVFGHLEEFVLFMYAERSPPAEWAGGKVVLEPCEGQDYYRRFVLGRGQQFRDKDAWMVVGKRRMRVMDLEFVEGW